MRRTANSVWASFPAAIVVATVLMTAPASAANEVLLIGEQPADRARLTRLWSSLAQSFEFTDVRIAIAGSPHEVGERVRQFLGTRGNADDRRLVWIAASGGATDAICPAWDEDFVRPQVPAVLVAPACIKFLVQAPSTYEPLRAPDDAAPPAGAPGVLFIDPSADEDPAALAAALAVPAAADGDAALRALVAALACPPEGAAKDGAADKVPVDFSPSSSAWRMAPPLCAKAKAPPPGDESSTPPAVEPPVAAAEAAPAEPASALPLPPAPRPFEAAMTEPMPAVPVTPVSVSAAPPLPVAPMPAVPAETTTLSFASPVAGKVASGFGTQAAGRTNKGVDFEAAPGTAVKAAQSGEVVYVGELPGYGNVVAIKHGNDWATVYGHASDISVTKGQIVEKGQDIAHVDPAKRLHFEVRHRGKPVDPRPMLASGGP